MLCTPRYNTAHLSEAHFVGQHAGLPVGGDLWLWWVFYINPRETGHWLPAGGLGQAFETNVPFEAFQQGCLLEHKTII